MMEQLHIKSGALLDSISSKIAGDLISGEAAYTAVQNTFRLAILAVDQSTSTTDNVTATTFPAPLSSLEQLLGVSASSVALPLSSTPMSVGLVQSKTQQYGNSSGGYNSNPMRILWLSDNSLNASTQNVEYTIQNTVPQTYGSGNLTAVQFNSTCVYGVAINYTYTCMNLAVPFDIHHGCNGTMEGVFSVSCPVTSLTPNCNMIPRGSTDSWYDGGCTVKSYTDLYLTCSCPLGTGASSGSGRKLLISEEDGFGGAEVVAMASYVGVGFVDTFNTVPQFTSPADLAQCLIVISMFVMLGTGGEYIVWVQHVCCCKVLYAQTLWEKQDPTPEKRIGTNHHRVPVVCVCQRSTASGI